MGNKESVIEKHGYTMERQVEQGDLVKSKDGKEYIIKQISLTQECGNVVEILENLSHPHIVGYQESFKGDDCLYIVLDYCVGGDLSQKIKVQSETGELFSEDQIMDWIVKICMALKHLHDNNILHRDLQPQNIFFTEFGTIRLGGLGEVNERYSFNSGRASGAGTLNDGALNYIAPEILNGSTYHDKSEIWSLGCVLYEMCMLKCAFTAESTIKLIPKILSGSYPALPETFSPDLRQLLSELLQVEPQNRPLVNDILGRPFIISFLTDKSEKTVEELQEILQKLRALADGLERVHFGTTVGSLTGGVIGAAGGITSLVGLALAPFTMGASLIVTGVGVGVAVAGGATAGASNITNMVNQSIDHKNVSNIIKEFQEKMNSVVACLQHISEALETLKQTSSSDPEQPSTAKGFASAGVRLGRGLGGVSELLRFIQVGNIGKLAAQAARAVRVAEVATGIFSAFFVAADIYFIAKDAKEIHEIIQTRGSESTEETGRLELKDTDSTTELQPGSAEKKPEVKSETMKFVLKIRETAEQLQLSLDELSEIISFIPKLTWDNFQFS